MGIKETALSDEEQGWLANASRRDVSGWIGLKTAGAPFARGFQHGYLVAAEYADAIRVYEARTYQSMGASALSSSSPRAS